MRRRQPAQARAWCMTSGREPSTATPTFTRSSSWDPFMSWWPLQTGFSKWLLILSNWPSQNVCYDTLDFYSSLCVSFEVMTTILLRSCWRGAGQCSGSKWVPVGSVSFSTCGPSSLPWSARSALKLKTDQAALIPGMWPGQISHTELRDHPSKYPSPLLWNTTRRYPQHSEWNISCCLGFYDSVSFYNVKLLLPWPCFLFTTNDFWLFYFLMFEINSWEMAYVDKWDSLVISVCFLLASPYQSVQWDH